MIDSDLSVVCLNVLAVCAILCATFGTLAFIPYCLLSLNQTIERLRPRKKASYALDTGVKEDPRQPPPTLTKIRKIEPLVEQPQKTVEIYCGRCGNQIRSGYTGVRYSSVPGEPGEEILQFDCEHCGAKVEIDD